MTEYELNELLVLIGENINAQFQFWMAATFAVVIVSYSAGHRLAYWARLVVAALYTATVVMIYFRYLVSVEQATPIFERVLELNPDISLTRGNAVTTLRQFVMFSGSLLAVVLVCVPAIGYRNQGGQDHG